MEMDMSNLTYLFNQGKKIWAVNYSWYIEGADQNILVDTAGEARLAATFRGYPAEEIMSFEDALNSVGLKPDDIDIVIQTHLQWDHCANTSKCRNARVLVTEEELKFAASPHPALAHTYIPDLLKGLNFVTVKGQYEVASGIQLIPAPGHTPGTQSVAINTEQGKAIITGFCCAKENFDPPEKIRATTPVITPGIHLNAADAFESALRIKELADIIIPVHEPSFAEVKSIP
jgi:glyoxylase-like metal-dependent hydrolase (beta-lactamase superfamily II)